MICVRQGLRKYKYKDKQTDKYKDNYKDKYKDKYKNKRQTYDVICFWKGDKGTFQKRFSGFCPLRGGVPPLSANEKILLFFTLIFVSGGGEYPPILLRKKSAKKHLFLD